MAKPRKTSCVPVSTPHPEAAHALTTEAIQAQVAITAGVALDCDDMPPSP
jgi:hypothetical protein